jgi:Cd2+/Zn2+-exporting ATPase
MAQAEGYREHTGRGVSAAVDGATVSVGNLALMREVGIAPTPIEGAGTVLYVARDGVYLGAIRMTDTLKPDAGAAIDALRALGVKKTVMLTGDREDSALAVAKTLSLDECRHSLLPAEKYETIEVLKKQGSVLYVGDGINDAPALTLADVGVAMGALGSDAAIEAADAVITTDSLSRLPLAVRLARLERFAPDSYRVSILNKWITSILYHQCSLEDIPL